MEKSAKIVIVDDEAMVTKTLSTLLKLEGFSDTQAFNDPLEALEYLKNNPCSLIISDFIMPKMNGIEFLSEAKKLPQHKDTTQILLTGYADKENAIKAINEVGIFKYIEKPWNNSDLIINIKNGVERTNLKLQLKEKMEQLQAANEQLENYSKNLEKLVTERTQELFKSTEKLNAIFTGCADTIATFDRNYRITSINKAAYTLFGTEPNELIGKNFFEVIINEKNQKFNPLKKAEPLFLHDFSVVNYESGQKIPVEISISNIKNEKESFFVAVIRDVLYQKENERLRDDFIATLTHDLRTPLLASISGFEFILNGTLGKTSQKQKELIEAMKKSAEDMLGLTNTLLEVYRYEAGKIYLCKTNFSVNELIKECAKELEMLFKKNCTKISLQLDESDPEINADKNEIRRVILNLMGNAVKHGGENTDIEIISTLNGRDLTVSVKDNGVGLSEEDCKKLFKRFSQGTSQKRSSSTGLGLYLSRRIIDAHGGTIGVESKPGQGSTFSFCLKNSVIESKVAF